MRSPLPDYPWDSLKPYVQRAREHPDGLVDLSVGSPVDPTPQFIAAALAKHADAPNYPLTSGSLELREAIAAWYGRRRGVTVAAEATLPTIGSKELVALLPMLLGLGAGDVVVHPRVAYPTYEIGAALVGATAVAADDPESWPAETKLIWLNSPANPTGEVKSVDYLRAAVARARELGAVIVNDECYAELGWAAQWQHTTTPCILHPDVVGSDHTGVLSVYSLSKQSNLAGYRTAFLAGDRGLVSQLLNVRKHAGLISPAPIQAAMVAALGDGSHVAEQKDRYRSRRTQLLRGLEATGFRVDYSEAGLYLWATRGEDCWRSVEFMSERGILVGPGTFYGEHSNEHIRISLTETDERVNAAVERLLAES